MIAIFEFPSLLLNFSIGKLLFLSFLLFPGFTIYSNGFQMTEGGNVESWILRIMDGGTFACGASYYSPRVALTSDICIHTYRKRLSELRLKFLSPDEEDPVNEVRILTVYVSQDWRWTENYMDIAVVKLSNLLRDHFKNSVQLCRKPLSSHHRLTIVGCGVGQDDEMRSEQV